MASLIPRYLVIWPPSGAHTASDMVHQAWEEVSTDKELIVRSFKKCGISVPIDGSEDDQIHIQGLEEYSVEEEDDDTDGDPFSDI